MNFVLFVYVAHLNKGFESVSNAQYLTLASEILTQFISRPYIFIFNKLREL